MPTHIVTMPYRALRRFIRDRALQHGVGAAQGDHLVRERRGGRDHLARLEEET